MAGHPAFSPQRHFLGWDRPLLDGTMDFLAAQFAATDLFGGCDLGRVDIVLPTTRAVRRIRERLAEAYPSDFAGDSLDPASPDGLDRRGPANVHHLADSGRITGPRIYTVGELAERLYSPPATIASSLERILAWAQVLRDCTAEELAPLLPASPPREPLGPWIEFAGTINRLHEDLAAAGLTFADIEGEVDIESDRRRWKLLAYVRKQYMARLASADLSDPHETRRQAIASKQCRSDRTMVLVGTTDLSVTLQAMLAQLAATVHVLIAAPPDAEKGFDTFGSVDRQWWANTTIPLDHDGLRTAGDIADQADAVSESIEDFRNRGKQRWTIGVTDDSQIGPVEFSLRSRGESVYRYSGFPLERSSVGRLLGHVAHYLERRTWDSVAALIRHPDLLSVLADQSSIGPDDLLKQLDQLLATHFPVRISDALPPLASERFAVVMSLPERIDAIVAPIREPHATLAQRCASLAGWIETIYDDGTPRHVRTDLSVAMVLDMLDGYQKLPSALDVSMTTTAVIEMILDQMSSQRVLTEPQPGDTEMLGWLDLSLDDADAMVVVGLNHPFVPAATTHDPFLPGSLRSRLKVSDNERRFARDAHALRCIVSSRSEVRLIVGQNSADGSPTPPSRLLAVADSDEVAARIRHLMRPREVISSSCHPWLGTATETQVTPPSLHCDTTLPTRPIETMSVTAFKEYLTCPYRFYLRRVLRLSPLDDASSELAANQFGDLVHHALEIFGESEHKDETHPDVIEAVMLDAVDEVAQRWYGPHVSASVRLQIGQAKRRIRYVARAQAERIADGWMIHQAEASVDEDVAGITVDGRRMGLRGRFDRIDHHPDSGRWAILDYKTHGHKPEKKHLAKNEAGETEWVDLQLPLYRRMIPFLGIDADIAQVQLGYFNIADKESETRINIAQFDPALMDQADRVIEQVVRDVFAGKFDPIETPPMYDDYGMILQTGIAAGMLTAAAGDER